MRTTIDRVISFGRAGNAQDCYAYGWSVPETGFTWTDGKAAGLVLPAPNAPFGFFMELFFWVNGGLDGAGTQRLALFVNGAEIGRSVTRHRMRLAWYVPPLPARDDRLIVNLDLPDARRGDDPRLLGLAMMSMRLMPLVERPAPFVRRIAAIPPLDDEAAARALVERVTTMPLRQLALELESLGANCEPGFFQRRCGAEPLSLLRFSGIVLYELVASIDCGFAGLGDEASIDPIVDETDLSDWIIYERRHLIRYHTWVRVSDASAEAMKRREVKRLPFLQRKLLEDLGDGTKTFVYQQDRAISDAELLPLFLAVRRWGRGALLCIAPAEEDHPAGLVREICPGLMRGYFSRFSNSQTGLSMPDWLAVCAAAWILRMAAPLAPSDPT
jgi:hypothetical protein